MHTRVTTRNRTITSCRQSIRAATARLGATTTRLARCSATPPPTGAGRAPPPSLQLLRPRSRRAAPGRAARTIPERCAGSTFARHHAERAVELGFRTRRLPLTERQFDVGDPSMAHTRRPCIRLRGTAVEERHQQPRRLQGPRWSAASCSCGGRSRAAPARLDGARTSAVRPPSRWPWGARNATRHPGDRAHQKRPPQAIGASRPPQRHHGAGVATQNHDYGPHLGRTSAICSRPQPPQAVAACAHGRDRGPLSDHPQRAGSARITSDTVLALRTSVVTRGGEAT
ncbi:hypothetical protein ABH925_003614 [Streptacidiphilus sp. EB129]